jgi:hypothetical protein
LAATAALSRSSRPNFRWPPRAVAVKGGRGPRDAA